MNINKFTIKSQEAIQQFWHKVTAKQQIENNEHILRMVFEGHSVKLF
jgi:hypothetical protein